MAKKKQSLKDIQDMYSENLEKVKKRAEAENVVLRERLALAKVKINELEKYIEKLATKED